MNHEILIIDDNIKIGKSLGQNFDQFGYKNHYASNSTEAYQLITSHNISAVLLDIVLGEEDGLEVLCNLLTLNRTLPVIMITGYGTIETAVQSIKNGAFDYVQKPLNFNKLLKILEKALKKPAITAGSIPANNPLPGHSLEMYTTNPEMLALCTKARRLAVTDIPILITGENGTGKELMADYIHAHSPRHSSRIVKINCAAFPESLLDNELFGHEKGAYTGATSTFIGVFEKAHKGSLMLDEIGDMPLTTQARILRFLQNKEIKRVGGNEIIKVDTRFIAATNKHLEKMVEDKKFREDLLFRLNAAVLSLPALRARKEDLPLLVDYFLKELTRDNTKRIHEVSPAVMECFFRYSWPGNIRELKNTLHYACALTVKDYIGLEDLPSRFGESALAAEPGKTQVSLKDTEKNMILHLLIQNRYNIKRTAEQLGISRKTLYNKLKKYESHAFNR